MGLDGAFLVLAAVFSAVLVGAGLAVRHWVRDAADYLVAGREMSGVLNTFGVAAIGFAGSSVTLVPAMTVLYGFWPALINQFIFSIGGLVLYGVVFAPFIRRCGAQTLPEWLEMRFDANVRLVVTVATILGLTGIMANNVVSIAIIISGFLDVSVPVAVSALFALFLLFSFLGGFWAITFTDFIQLLVSLVAIPLILVSLVRFFGGASWVAHHTSAWGWEGSMGRLPVFSLQFPSILTTVVLFAGFLVWGNNYYWLRAASCRTERAARWSYVAAGFLLSLLVYLPLLLVGLYAVAAFPGEMQNAGFLEAPQAYGLVLRRLPVPLAAVLLLTPLAAGISTATTAHIGAAAVAVRDIYQRRFRPGCSARELLIPSRIILVVLGVLVWLLTFYPGGPVLLFAFANAWLGPPALLLLLGMVSRRMTAAAALNLTGASMTSMVVLTALELAGVFAVSRYVHVGMVGLGVAVAAVLVTTVVERIASSRVPPGELSGEPPGELPEEPVADDRTLLQLVAWGYHCMAELVDLSGEDAAVVARRTRRLIRAGLLTAAGAAGRRQYQFSLTAAGVGALPPGAPHHDPLQDEILARLQTPGGDIRELTADGTITSLRLSGTLAAMVRRGVLRERGFWRRSVRIAP